MDRHSASAFSALPLWPLPLACAGLFLLAIHLSYLIAATHGHVSWCLPYWLDCTSISATGRQLPEKLVFKPLLTVAATGLMAYWFLMGRWLRLQGVMGRRPRTVALLGSIGGLCLIFYTASLGEGGETALVLRRLSAVLGFSLNYLAQLLLTAELRRGEVPAVSSNASTVRYLWWLVVGMLMLGMLSALTGSFAVHDCIDDGVEWVLALMLNVHVALTARLWWGNKLGLDLKLQ